MFSLESQHKALRLAFKIMEKAHNLEFVIDRSVPAKSHLVAVVSIKMSKRKVCLRSIF